ncbi:MAG: asparagine synthase (glutamine-hydrolyzing) [Micavibrio sp.]|nr:asparagine synthase (glutamine-hydrolyzing) [Micavibrio sp.]
MCGLTGFYVCENRGSRAEMHTNVRRMCAALAHRGPDSGDIWQDAEAPIALGHRRLAVLDLSREGAQPKASPSGRYHIVYNGEIYNHLDLRRELEAGGRSFSGRSDTETLLVAIEAWGISRTLKNIVGMFAFALWDAKEKMLHFARDRMGKKPLYIGWAGKALVFASELKALRAHPDFVAEINNVAMGEYMNFMCVSALQTIYKNVWHLPPGHRMSVKVDDLKAQQDLLNHMQSYWDAREINAISVGRNVADEASVLRGFEENLEIAVKERMLSDVPLGAFLSGGIDSSLVTALMQKHSAQAIKTFSIGFDDAAYDEAVYAKKIAEHLGCEHTEYYCTEKDAMDVIPKLADMFDEPFADQSAIPTYMVSKFAREKVTVALSGDGGDELLGGYTRHRQGAKLWRKMKAVPRPIRQGAALMLNYAGSGFKGDAQKASHIRKLSQALSSSNLQELYLNMLRQGDGYQLSGNYDLPALHQIDDLSIEEQMMIWDTQFYLPSDVLTKVDRASMAVSLEVRAPLLDHRLFEYVWGLPLDYKIRDGKGKYMLRKILSRHVPDALFERPKQGFNMPIANWLRGALREWAEELLDEKAMREQGLLDVGAVRKIWTRHLGGDDRHANAIWAILMFQAWRVRWMS